MVTSLLLTMGIIIKLKRNVLPPLLKVSVGLQCNYVYATWDMTLCQPTVCTTEHLGLDTARNIHHSASAASAATHY